MLPVVLFLLQQPVEFVWPPEPEQVIVLEGRNEISSPGLGDICRQMQSNHLEDLDVLERAYQRLTVSTDADQISEILKQIKKISTRIRFLAKPEWNSENIPIVIRWDVPNSFFFDNSEYLKIKAAIRSGEWDNLGKFVLSPPGYVLDKALIKAEYLNAENNDIIKFLSLNPDDYRSEYLSDRSFLIKLKKNVTALEACQFLKTLTFEVKISYGSSFLGRFFKEDKNIFLVYRKENPSAN